MLEIRLVYEDYVVCGLCGRQYKQLVNKKHLLFHGLSVIEYEDRFGKGSRVSIKESNKRRNLLRSIDMTGNRVKMQKLGLIKYGGACTRGFKHFKKRKKLQNSNIVLDLKQRDLLPFIFENKKYSRSDAFRKGVSDRMKLDNPMKREEIWKKNILKHNREKSSIEIWFEDFCSRFNFPFVYCGNNKIWINGKNPDFIFNKKVVEISSDYKGRDEAYDKFRIEHFRNSGFDCMVITLWYIPLDLRESIEKFLYGELITFLNKISFEDIKIITIPDFRGKIRMRVAI